MWWYKRRQKKLVITITAAADNTDACSIKGEANANYRNGSLSSILKAKTGKKTCRANSLGVMVGVKARTSTGMDNKAIYATTQPKLKPTTLSASMGVEGASTGSDSGRLETMEASDAKKSMAMCVF